MDSLMFVLTLIKSLNLMLWKSVIQEAVVAVSYENSLLGILII